MGRVRDCSRRRFITCVVNSLQACPECSYLATAKYIKRVQIHLFVFFQFLMVYLSNLCKFCSIIRMLNSIIWLTCLSCCWSRCCGSSSPTFLWASNTLGYQHVIQSENWRFLWIRDSRGWVLTSSAADLGVPPLEYSSETKQFFPLFRIGLKTAPVSFCDSSTYVSWLGLRQGSGRWCSWFAAKSPRCPASGVHSLHLMGYRLL